MADIKHCYWRQFFHTTTQKCSYWCETDIISQRSEGWQLFIGNSIIHRCLVMELQWGNQDKGYRLISAVTLWPLYLSVSEKPSANTYVLAKCCLCWHCPWKKCDKEIQSWWIKCHFWRYWLCQLFHHRLPTHQGAPEGSKIMSKPVCGLLQHKVVMLMSDDSFIFNSDFLALPSLCCNKPKDYKYNANEVHCKCILLFSPLIKFTTQLHRINTRI